MQSETRRTNYGAVVLDSLARQTLVSNSSVTRNRHVSNDALLPISYGTAFVNKRPAFILHKRHLLGVVLKGIANVHVKMLDL